MKFATLITIALVTLITTTVSAKHLQISYVKENSNIGSQDAVALNTVFISGYELNSTLKQKLFPKNAVFVILTHKNSTNIITIRSPHNCGTRITKRCIGTYLYGTDTNGKKWTINTKGYF